MTDEPLVVFEGAAKLRNGIWFRRVALYRDCVVFDVFASRPFAPVDLENLRLTDNLDTKYEMRRPLPLVPLDGKGRIEFVPAVPAGWTRLELGEPGWSLHIPNPG